MKALALLSLLLVAPLLRAGEVTVFAAASLTDSLREIATGYEKATSMKVTFNFAASNVLVQQIQAGAPADLFFSADEAKMDQLEKEGLLAPGTRKNLLGNSLVVITLPDGPTISTAADLDQPSIKHLSLGDPKAVPAGVYAKAWLEKAGLWEKLQPKVAPAENVRAAMAVVESGNAEAGVVYKTDAAISKKVKVAFEVPVSDAPEITYPAALLKDSRNATESRKFLAWLAEKEADATFTKFGFSVID